MSKKFIWEHRDIKIDTQLTTCNCCQGKGTTGEGVFKKICPVCHGVGKIRI